MEDLTVDLEIKTEDLVVDPGDLEIVMEDLVVSKYNNDIVQAKIKYPKLLILILPQTFSTSVGTKIVHARRGEGTKIYFQIPWSYGKLTCRTKNAYGEVLIFDEGTYHGTYAECTYWDTRDESSTHPIQLELNGVTYHTGELTALANGPIAGDYVVYILLVIVIAIS